MKENEELNEEIKKICLKIQSEWKLTGNLVKDFTIVTKRESNIKGDFEQNSNDHMLDDFSKMLLGKIYAGMELYLGKFGVSHVDSILKCWIEQSIKKEAQRRIEGHKNQKTEDSDMNPQQNREPITLAGGMMYA